jgi:energy-converting hydrogenase A subunit M
MWADEVIDILATCQAMSSCDALQACEKSVFGGS